MTKYLLFCCIAASTALSVLTAPASNEALDKVGNDLGGHSSITREHYKVYRKLGYYLDKATVNDSQLNAVSEEKRVEQTVQPANTSASTVEILGITTGAYAPSPSVPAVENPPFKPQRAGSMFVRLIDDIFQIPINVLQNVARLIVSPFLQGRKAPEELATVS